MGPFQGVTITTTRVHLGPQDLVTIKLGSMQPENITSENALLAVPGGNDQKWIRGNHTGVIVGMRNMEVDQIDKLHVVQDRNVSIDGSVHTSITEKDVTEIHGERKLTVFGHDTEEYAVHREVNEPFLYEKKGYDGAIKGISLDIVGLDTSITAVDAQTAGIAVGAAAIELEQKAIHNRMEGLRSHVAGFVDGFCGFAVKVETEVNASATMSADHLG